jgi:RsiW-degrading membrane proteinase PrsW (M82 family)
MILLFSAIIPVAVFLYCIYRKDTEKEPLKLLLKCFLWGCLATIPIILIELLLKLGDLVFTSPFANAFYNAFIVAAVVEEGVKFLCLKWLNWKHKHFDQYFDGIIYAVFISLGFAMIENVLYVIQNGMGTAVMRAVFAVPMHGLCGVMMGYFFSLARFSPVEKQRKLLWYGFLIPVAFHGLYDFCLMYFLPQVEYDTSVILLFLLVFAAVVIFSWRIGIKNIKRHITQDKANQKEQELLANQEQNNK